MKQLGSLLLKRLKSSKKKNATRALPAKSGRRKNRLFYLAANAPTQRTQKPVTLPEKIVEKLPEKSMVLAAKPMLSLQAAGTTGLVTKDLIHPDQRLRASIEAFLLDQRSEHTRRAYGKDLKRFVKFLSGRKFLSGIETIDRAAIIAYKDSLLSEGLEHTTIDRHLASLRSFFRWLVEDGVISKSPVENVRFLNPKRESTTIGFTDEEVLKLLKIPNLHTRVGSLHYAILMVLFYCGLRRSELCSIRTSHLGFERGHHYFKLRGKGNAERIVVMIGPVWNAIQHYLKMCRKDLKHDQPLFSPIRNNRTGVREKPLDPSMIYYIVSRQAKLAGVTNRVSPHSCRATAISNARDHNVPDRAIQEFAGWATTTMITRYDKRKSALEKSAAHAISYGSKQRNLPYLKEEPAAIPSVTESSSNLNKK